MTQPIPNARRLNYVPTAYNPDTVLTNPNPAGAPPAFARVPALAANASQTYVGGADTITGAEYDTANRAFLVWNDQTSNSNLTVTVAGTVIATVRPGTGTTIGPLAPNGPSITVTAGNGPVTYRIDPA